MQVVCSESNIPDAQELNLAHGTEHLPACGVDPGCHTHPTRSDEVACLEVEVIDQLLTPGLSVALVALDEQVF